MLDHFITSFLRDSFYCQEQTRKIRTTESHRGDNRIGQQSKNITSHGQLFKVAGKIAFPVESMNVRWRWRSSETGQCTDPEAGNGESKRLPLPNQASIMPVSYTRGQTAYGGFTIHHMYQHTLVFGRAIGTPGSRDSSSRGTGSKLTGSTTIWLRRFVLYIYTHTRALTHTSTRTYVGSCARAMHTSNANILLRLCLLAGWCTGTDWIWSL